MRNRTIRHSLAAMLLLLPASCAQPAHTRAAKPPRIGDVETRHWIHSDRLRSVMAELERKALTSWPQEIENEYAAKNGDAAAKALDDARKLAQDLANTAVLIPRAVAATKMPEADRRGFDAQAKTLADQAQRLRNAARLNDLDQMRRDLSSISDTCRACHERFRDISGPLATKEPPP